jgi:prepilin-type N-terminal cleavage/methylation domain-containing protein
LVKDDQRVQRISSKKSNQGFTLVEALISLIILAILAVAISGLYLGGIRAVDAQIDQAVFDSYLRSRMEALLSMNFDQLADGSEVVSVGGHNHTISWTIVNIDLDGDYTPEPAAKQVTVYSDRGTLTTLVVDHEDRLGSL